MKKTYRTLVSLVMCAAMAGGTCLPAAAGESFTDSIGINRTEGYTYDPEEVMYLSGVRFLADTPGARYTLRDLDEDGISELFVSAGDHTAVYVYDKALDQAVRSSEYDSEISSLVSDDSAVWVDASQWTDGTICGVVLQTGDPGVRADYYASANYDWLSQAHAKNQGDSVDQTAQYVSANEKKRQMFEDRDQYQGEDIQRIRDLYDIATDWDRREEEGIEPVRKYLDAIDRIDSIQAMSDYLADPEQSPFCMFMNFYVTLDLKDTSRWIVKIQGDDFSILPRTYHNSDDAQIAADRTEYDVIARYVLERAGYDPREIDRIMEEFYETENALLEKDWPDDNEKEDDRLLTSLPLDTMASECENFPLGRLFEAYRITEGCATVEYPEYLRELDSMYTEENLSKLKSYCLVHTAYAASSCLDLETKNAYYHHVGPDEDHPKDTKETESSDAYTEESLNEWYRNEYLSAKGITGVAAENAYMTYFADDEDRRDILLLASQIKDTFRQILEGEEWMSEKGRQACVEKLDNMEFCVLKPDEMIDSSYLSVDPGSSYLDAFAAVTVNTKKHNGEMVGQERRKGEWRYDLSPDVAPSADNCFYYGAYNQFFILNGFLNDRTYRKDMSIEQKLGTIGEVIGHELTHGFDPNGIQYDKNGNKVATDEDPSGWMPEEDYRAYNERAGKLAEYFSSFIPFPYNRCDGTIYQGEAAADITGMETGLKIASGIEGFDYDLYFRSHAKLWSKQSTLVVEQGDIFDEHPLYYLRINATCQQFEEFHKTYDIKEGDRMYLAPEERICIW